MSAQQVLEELIGELGMAFHPDRPVASYRVTDEGKVGDAQLMSFLDPVGELTSHPLFTPQDAMRLQAGLDAAWAVYGDGIYDLIREIEPWKAFFEQAES